MQINTSPEPQPYLVDDYEFQFSNGILMNLSVAKDLGDTVDFNTTPMAAIFHFAEKASPVDDETRLPAEEVTVLMSHVLSISHRIRSVTPPTKQQKDLFHSTLFKAPKSVQ